MTNDNGPSDCDRHLDEALGLLDAAIGALANETAFGFSVVSRQLKEIRQSVKEAQGDLRREMKRHDSR